jgi:magnesium transporter
MQEEFGLHDLAIEDARHDHQRPKIEEYGDTLFVVMHIVEADHSELTVGEFSVFVGRNFILSIRNRSNQSFPGCASVASASRNCCVWARASCSIR